MTLTPTRRTRRTTRTSPASPAPHDPAGPDAMDQQATARDERAAMPDQAAAAASPEATAPTGAPPSPSPSEDATPEPVEPPAHAAPAAPVTKAAQLQALLATANGATLARLCEALGWQSHTVRAALTRLRQAGHAVERSRTEDGQTLYRLGPIGPATTVNPETLPPEAEVTVKLLVSSARPTSFFAALQDGEPS